MNIFLTDIEKNNLSDWVYQVEDNSFITKIFTPFWNWLVKLIPSYISPNIITIAGFLCTIYGFHLSTILLKNHYSIGCICVIVLTFLYMTLDAIDGKHARRTKTNSALGELLDHICDSIGLVFIVFTFCYIFNIQDLTKQ